MLFIKTISKARDGDGDGFVNDGTPSMRPVGPQDLVKVRASDGVEMEMAPPAKLFQSQHKVKKDWAKVRAVDPAKRHNIAKFYADMPDMDEDAKASWDTAAKEIDQQFDLLTKKLGIKVEFVDEDPYRDFFQMRQEVGRTGVLKVLKTSATGGHPYWSDETNDRFRAIHDAFGHLGTGRGFDRHGEEAAYQAHISMFSDAAKPALATELRGQNSFLIDNGEFPPQKVGILPEELRKRLQLLFKAARTITSDDDNLYTSGGSHHVSNGRHFANVSKAPRDGDGDGFVNDGKPSMRPVGYLPTHLSIQTVGESNRNKYIAGTGEGEPGKRKVRFLKKRTSPERNLTDIPVGEVGKKTAKGYTFGSGQRGAAERIMRLIPGMRSVRPVHNPDGLEDDYAEGIVQRMVQNLSIVLSTITPEEIQKNRRWYEAAHNEAVALAGTDFHPDAAAAVLALLSPQKNWFDNVEQARLLFNIKRTNPVITTKDVEQARAWEKTHPTSDAVPDGELEKWVGKRWSDMQADPVAQTRITRILLTKPVPGHPVTSDGRAGFYDLDIDGDHMIPIDGEPKSVVPQNDSNLMKAVWFIQNPDPVTLDFALGDAIKVRSFYNNIRDPNDPHNDVTVDAHAWSAANGLYMPGDSDMAKKTQYATPVGEGPTGSLLAIEAYRRIADQLGMTPREVQSIIWAAWQKQADPPAGTRWSKKKNAPRKKALVDLWTEVDKAKGEKQQVLLLAMRQHLINFMNGEMP